ncbi:coiled-coil domain-containing protein 34-like [Canis lupus familiaris]|uniref:coiled-coil domain-containing protein 34-like n=1 Tax=Canis lupus familiaris TaxID=9615 RepID=UPI0018F6522E|nr:coiled-coil domain-containing protein 34-like [Canis lupus familiaris]
MWAAGRWGPGSPPPSSRAAAVLGAGGWGQGPPSRSDSTLSLLSPLGHQSCPLDSDDGDAEDGAGAEAEAGVQVELEVEVAALRGLRFRGSASVVESEDNQEEQKQVHLPESRLTPWEVWFVGKEKEERDRLQQKALEVKLGRILFCLIYEFTY